MRGLTARREQWSVRSLSLLLQCRKSQKTLCWSVPALLEALTRVSRETLPLISRSQSPGRQTGPRTGGHTTRREHAVQAAAYTGSMVLTLGGMTYDRSGPATYSCAPTSLHLPHCRMHLRSKKLFSRLAFLFFSTGHRQAIKRTLARLKLCDNDARRDRHQ